MFDFSYDFFRLYPRLSSPDFGLLSGGLSETSHEDAVSIHIYLGPSGPSAIVMDRDG